MATNNVINNVVALQGLYVALGGDAADVANITTIAEMLTALSTVAAAAASELPVVTDTDNGDVLTVVEGKWAKAAAPVELPAVTADDNNDVLTVVEGVWAKATPASGIEYFDVTFTPGSTGSSGTSGTFDKTKGEILNAHRNGKLIRVNFVGSNDTTLLIFAGTWGASASSADQHMTFASFSSDEYGVYVTTLSFRVGTGSSAPDQIQWRTMSSIVS